MTLLKGRFGYGLKLGKVQYLLVAACFVFGGNFCRAPEGALARRIVSFFLSVISVCSVVKNIKNKGTLAPLLSVFPKLIAVIPQARLANC